MAIIYVPRVWGGTLILTITPPSAPLPTVLITAVFEDGNVQANFEGDF